jgi:hypothetical protein
MALPILIAGSKLYGSAVSDASCASDVCFMLLLLRLDSSAFLLQSKRGARRREADAALGFGQATASVTASLSHA